MKSRSSITMRLAAALALLTAISCALTFALADDDEIVASPAAVDADIQEINVNFDAWVFPGAPTPEAGRQRLQKQIDLQLAEIFRLCHLRPEQESKLRLAGRGDLQRFLDEVEAVRRKMNKGKGDRQAINEMWQHVQPLQAKQAKGITGPDSLLAKSLARMLTSEQVVEYDLALLDRRRFRYQAAIAAALHELENNVALKHEQRETLTKLLLELPPPKAFGEYDQTLVNYRLASLPVARIKPLFDDRQWQALQQQLAQARGMRSQLLEEGVLDREEAEAKPAEARP